jgi:pheromone shutdown protein TraB
MATRSVLFGIELPIVVRMMNIIGATRDKVIARLILNACERFRTTEGPIIAIVGLLHVNGIADLLEKSEA